MENESWMILEKVVVVYVHGDVGRGSCCMVWEENKPILFCDLIIVVVLWILCC